MALTKISTAMISQSAAAVDLNVDAGTFYVDTTNNRVGVGGKTDPDTPLHVVGTVTATLFAGSGASLTNIPNGALTNSSITINSTATSLGGSITLGTDDVAEGSSNLYYTNARADARIAAASTSDLSEGTNLYYTDARVDARVSGGSLGNITTTGYIRGPATFTLDPAAHGDNTGTVVIAGNLQVDGTTTTINSTTMTVDDKNITLASGSANAAAASGAGFTVDIGTGTNPAITYDGTNDEWDFNKDINVTGTISSGAITSSGSITATNTIFNTGSTTVAAILRGGDGNSKNLVFQKTTGSTQQAKISAVGDDLRFTTGTTHERMRISSSGNIGIGTDNPETKLDVEIDSSLVYTSAMSGVSSYSPSASDIIQVRNAESGVDDIYAGIWFETGNGATNTTGTDRSGRIALVVDNDNDYSSNFVFQTRGTAGTLTEKLRIQGNGNIGIGTAAPDAKLRIDHDANSVAFKVTGGNGGSNLAEFVRDIGATASVSIHANSGNPQIKLASAGNTFALGVNSNTFEIADNSVLGTNTRFAITNTGNVGIGTISPTTNLEVAGTAPVIRLTDSRLLDNPSWDNVSLGSVQFYTSDTSFPGPRVGAEIEAFADGNSASAPNFNLLFKTATNTGTATEKLRIDKDGNVGIGTNDPQQKLHVQGDVLIRGSASSTGVSDLIFRTIYDTGALKSAYTNPAQITETYLAFHANTSGDSNGTNSEQMRIAGNKVGIGTSAPYTKLEVKGANQTFTAHFGQGTNNSSGDWGGISLGYSENNNSYRKVGIAAKAVGDGAARQELHFLVDSVNDGNNADINDSKMVIDIDGNVGIGTNNPGAKLHLLQGGETYDDGIKLVGTSGPISGRLYMSGEHLRIDNATAGSGSGLTLDDTGKIGINEINPDYNLEVNGTTSLGGGGNATHRIGRLSVGYLSNANPVLSSDGTQINFSDEIALRGVGIRKISTSPGDLNIFQDRTGYDIAFKTCPTTNASHEEVIRFTHDRKVGIGTTSPNTTLDISHQISTDGIEYPVIVAGIDVGNTVDQLVTSGIGIQFRLAGNNSTGDSLIGAGIAAMRESDSDTNSSTGLAFLVTQTDSTLDEAVRIDHDGNLLVAKTVNNTFNEGFVAKAAGGANITSAGNTALDLNRRTNNGTILNFRKDNATVGSIDSVGDADIKVVLSGDEDQYIIGNSAANYMSFSAANQERMRIDASGNLFVGLTEEPTANEAGLMISPVGFIKCSRNGASAKTHFQFFNDNGVVGSIVTTGSTTTYNTSSDARLKENIVDAPSASDDIDAIQVRSFDWKADGPHQKYGMVAQELLEVTPDVVYQPENEEDMMGVDYSKLVPMLVKEIQSLRARVAQLEQ